MAISAGLISAGGSFKDYSAVLLKEEYMAEAKATAAQTSLMDRYKTVLDTIDTSITNNRNTISGGVIDSKLDSELQMGKAVLVQAILEGRALPIDSWNSILKLAGAETEETAGEEEDSEGGFISAVGGFLGAAMKDLNPKLRELQKLLKSNIDKDDVVRGPRGAVYQGTPEQAKKALGNAKENVQAIKDWWASITFGADRLEEEQPADTEGPDPSLQATYGDPFGIGLINQGTATPEQEATMAAGGTKGGSEYVGPEIGQETVNGIPQTGVGSEATTRSLFEDVGGPIGEPAGKTTVRDFVIGKPKVEIEVSSPEIEERKSTILSNVFSAIKGVESNVMGYNAVADTTDGDRGLTTSTVKEVLDKHGNTAVGVGQFKYKEFMKPTAEKWFGMTEDQLKEQMFTPQFQDALLIAGIYDAGLQQFVDDKISVDVFQKRLANIWRGLPPTRETKEGDIVDEFENKARMSGEEFRSLLLQFNTMTKGLIQEGTESLQGIMGQ
jgi:hypothetical protein